MSKNKKGKVIQFQPISPEKYIRENGRKLEMGKCYITQFNDDVVMQVMITRIKKNGKLIVGFYLIDCGCLGVKDTYFIEFDDHDDFRENIMEMDEYEEFGREITPNYAQNLIYGALEWAEDAGIKPHAGFKVTEFLLDEVDELEYEEIEFGRNGKYFYIEGPDDKTSQILQTLDKNVGEGNYTFIGKRDFYDAKSGEFYDSDLDDDDYEEFEGDVEDRYENELLEIERQLEESPDLFLDKAIFVRIDKKEDALIGMVSLIASIINMYVSENEIDEGDFRKSLPELKTHIIECLQKAPEIESDPLFLVENLPIEVLLFNCLVHGTYLFTYLPAFRSGSRKFIDIDIDDYLTAVAYFDFWADIESRIIYQTIRLNIELSSSNNSMASKKSIKVNMLETIEFVINEIDNLETNFTDLKPLLELMLIFMYYPIPNKKEYLKLVMPDNE